MSLEIEFRQEWRQLAAECETLLASLNAFASALSHQAGLDLKSTLSSIPSSLCLWLHLRLPLNHLLPHLTDSKCRDFDHCLNLSPKHIETAKIWDEKLCDMWGYGEFRPDIRRGRETISLLGIGFCWHYLSSDVLSVHHERPSCLCQVLFARRDV